MPSNATPAARPNSAQPDSAQPAAARPAFAHLGVLDGWRGISIVCVLAAHLLPLGPARFHFNASVANFGMVMFFTLSGYLITSTLLARPSVPDFLIRRFCRIVPLAWLYLLFALPLAAAPLAHYLPMFLFYGNLPPFALDPVDAQFWSLCVEMQFYLYLALLATLFPRRWPVFLPLTALAVTTLRVLTHTHISILTWYRVDEILAGGILALLATRYPAYFQTHFGPLSAARLRQFLFPFGFLLLFLSCEPASGPIQYLRPYLSAALIGITVFDPHNRFYAPLRGRILTFLASISYSLYVLHSTMMVGGFDPANKILKYERRAFGFLLLFLFAWLSTRFYESAWIAWGKSLIRRRHQHPSPA